MVQQFLVCLLSQFQTYPSMHTTVIIIILSDIIITATMYLNVAMYLQDSCPVQGTCCTYKPGTPFFSCVSSHTGRLLDTRTLCVLQAAIHIKHNNNVTKSRHFPNHTAMSDCEITQPEYCMVQYDMHKLFSVKKRTNSSLSLSIQTNPATERYK